MTIYDELRAKLADGNAAYVSDRVIDDVTAKRLASLIRCRCVYRFREARYEFNVHAVRKAHRLDVVIA